MFLLCFKDINNYSNLNLLYLWPIKNKENYRKVWASNQERILTFIVYLSYIALFFFTSSDPFFGDAKSTISRLAYPAFESNFNIWLYPEGMDPGHPVLVPLIHAFLWKIFGARLWISHLFTFGFTLLALCFAQRIDKQYKSNGWFLLLIAINPLFIALSASLNSHIILVACFLGFLSFQLKGKTIQQMLCIAGLLITHNQGMLIAVVLIIAQFIVERNIKRTLQLTLAFLPWFLWLAIHYSQTGWFLFPPEYAEFRGVGTLPTLIKNAAIIVWRLADFGLFILIILALAYQIKTRDKKMLSIYLIALGVIGSVWLSVKFSIAHRYLIFAHLTLTIPAALYLKNRSHWMKTIVVILIISGSFWYYPGKQLSDANIQFRHYFDIYKTIQSESITSNYALFSTPPNESESTITHLSNNPKLVQIRSLSLVRDTSNIQRVMHGNVCGPLSKETKHLIQEWDFITIQSGPAWVNIYSKQPIEDKLKAKYPKRKATWLEEKMLNLKKRYK